MLGIPAEDRQRIFDWTNQMTGAEDEDMAREDNDPEAAAAEVLMYSMGLAAERKANPRDDIVTKLVQSGEDGGRGLTDDEFGFFVITLAVAGNETTRNATTHGMKAFFDNPDQWDLWVRERPATMIDEVIRWATPVTSFQRTALEDVELGGVQIKAGQRVGLFYASANHDEEVFEDAFTFDITRDPNPHLAFGGRGAHYCIGANLARSEIKLIFDALADLAPNIRPDRRRLPPASGWLNGIKSAARRVQRLNPEGASGSGWGVSPAVTPMWRHARSREATEHDHSRFPHEEVRRLHRRRRRLVHRTLRTSHRLSRPQRRRQVHHHARHGRPDGADLRVKH